MTVAHHPAYLGSRLQQHHSFSDHPVAPMKPLCNLYLPPVMVSRVYGCFGIAFTGSLNIYIKLALFLGKGGFRKNQARVLPRSFQKDLREGSFQDPSVVPDLKYDRQVMIIFCH